MAFAAAFENRKTSLLDDTVVVLEDKAMRERAEISVALGFNCYRWQKGAMELLYAAPNFYQGTPPTRSGIPILFPFPNRIRGGRFTWDGKAYRLIPNDPAARNAIHGFVCRRRWQVLESGADHDSAWVTAEFLGSRDAADCVALWPADYLIRVTYRLAAGKLRIEADISNPDSKPLPWGLGYHHYFAMTSEADSRLLVPARSRWELIETLPTGRILPVEAACDLRQAKSLSQLTLDDVLTDVTDRRKSDGLVYRGSVMREAGVEIQMFTSAEFREVVVFTPPHRQAVCIEPYTCMTDAINLEQQGIKAGLRVLQPGEQWRSVVETRLL